MLLQYIQWKEAVAGAVSGALTVLVLHPLDVVKTRLQVQESKPEKGFASRYKGALHAFRVIHRREGIRGLYSGAWVVLIHVLRVLSLRQYCIPHSRAPVQNKARRPHCWPQPHN